MELKLCMTVNVCIEYMHMLVSMNVTLTQGHSGWLGRGKVVPLNYLDNKASSKR